MALCRLLKSCVANKYNLLKRKINSKISYPHENVVQTSSDGIFSAEEKKKKKKIETVRQKKMS